MITNFDKAFDNLLISEGDYSDNPADPGGRTRFGITQKVARDSGYEGNMKDFPRELAKNIYQKKYWREFMDTLAYPLAFTIFDAAVHSGNIQANVWLQKALIVNVDGRIGPQTLAALEKSDSARVVSIINAHRLLFLTHLPTWSNFSKGWTRRIANNLLGI